MTVDSSQRFSRQHPCPICGGYDSMPRGNGKRCSGFLSSDGLYAHCSREELAGGLPQESGGTFAHRLIGSCRCGGQHGHDIPRPVIDATYPYTDEKGELLFEVVRFSPKDFRQRTPDGAGGWRWSIKGVRRVLYRLRELVEDDADRTVFFVEGERDVESLERLGHLATCNPMGAEDKWKYVSEHARTVLRGRDVVVVADADDVGRRHARTIEASLCDVAKSLRMLEPPAPYKDVTELLGAGGTLESLVPLREVEHDEHDPSRRQKCLQGGVALREVPAESADTFRLISQPARVFEEVPAPRRWLLRDTRTSRGLMVCGHVSAMVGAGGAGKSWALLELGLAVATGTPWLGVFATSAAAPAAVLLAEETDEEIARRLFHARAAVGAPIPAPGMLHTIGLRGRDCRLLDANGHSTAFAGSLQDCLSRIDGLHVVCVDPLTRFTAQGAESDNSLATRAIASLEALGVSTVFGHHSSAIARRSKDRRQADEALGRGVTGINDGVRWNSELVSVRLEHSSDDIQARLGNVVRYSAGKSNYSGAWEDVWLRRDAAHEGALVPVDEFDRKEIEHAMAVAGSPDRQSVDAESVIRAAISARGGSFNGGTAELATQVGLRKDAVRKAVKVMILKGDINASGTYHSPVYTTAKRTDEG